MSKGGAFSFSFPIVTSIVVSIVTVRAAERRLLARATLAHWAELPPAGWLPSRNATDAIALEGFSVFISTVLVGW